jgi:hypothetical protein
VATNYRKRLLPKSGPVCASSELILSGCSSICPFTPSSVGYLIPHSLGVGRPLSGPRAPDPRLHRPACLHGWSSLIIFDPVASLVEPLAGVSLCACCSGQLYRHPGRDADLTSAENNKLRDTTTSRRSWSAFSHWRDQRDVESDATGSDVAEKAPQNLQRRSLMWLLGGPSSAVKSSVHGLAQAQQTPGPTRPQRALGGAGQKTLIIPHWWKPLSLSQVSECSVCSQTVVSNAGELSDSM